MTMFGVIDGLSFAKKWLRDAPTWTINHRTTRRQWFWSSTSGARPSGSRQLTQSASRHLPMQS